MYVCVCIINITYVTATLGSATPPYHGTTAANAANIPGKLWASLAELWSSAKDPQARAAAANASGQDATGA
jgi:hypothetical protein